MTGTDMKSAGILTPFERSGWERSLFVVSVHGGDGHAKMMTDAFLRGAFAIFEYVDQATGFIVTSLSHRPSGGRVRLFASLESAAIAAELAEAAGDWRTFCEATCPDGTLWQTTRAAWLAAGLEQSIWYS